LRWKRAQHIDGSAREPLGPTTQKGKKVLPEPFSRGALGAYLTGYNAFGLEALGRRQTG